MTILKTDCYALNGKEIYKKGSDVALKQHKFWAWAAVFCFMMVFYTGYKHK